MKPNDNIGFIIKLIHDAIRARADSELREAGLTLSQSRVLGFLGRRHGEPACQKDIEEFFHVTHPTMIGILQRLETKGFIQSAVNSQDRRFRDIRLTPKGEQQQSAMHEHIQHMEQIMLTGLTVQETAQLRGFLNTIYRNITENQPKPA